MIHRSLTRRKAVNHIVAALSAAAALVGIVVLAWILLVVFKRGVEAMNWGFFTNADPGPGAGGGVGHAIVGSLMLVGLAVVIGAPIGLLAGVFLAEFGRDTRLGDIVRFSANTMLGFPSIIVGLFVYAVMVVPMGGFSGWAGAVALAIIILPVVARTTEEMLQLVPNSLRESALALGAPRWKVTLGVVFRAARTGLLTGVLLAVARISGETAPLLFTCLNSPYWPKSLNGWVANLPMTIFTHAMSPYPDWVKLAWGASLLIMVSVLVLNVVMRALLKKGSHA